MFTPRKIFLAALALIIVVAGMGFTTQSAQAAGCTQYHIVRRGENLYRIGLRYGVSWRYLADLNNIRNPRKIYTGQKLCVSTSGQYYPPSSSGSASSDSWSFRVIEVEKDTSVTIKTANLPDNVLFESYIGRDKGNNTKWIQSNDFDTDKGGSIKATFLIPEEYKGDSPLVIKLVQHKKNKDVTYSQVFTNATRSYQSGSGTPTYPYYGGIPTIWIQSVVRNQSVTIKTNNFPSNLKFDVYMGPMGTRAINGYHVGTLNSGNGGTLTATYTIPTALRGSYKIAIRTQNSPTGYYSYNWFFNNTTR
jgi:hypothetical protein